MTDNLYPAARFELLPESQMQPRITPRLVILHTNGGPKSTSPASLHAYMARADVNVECHFDVGTGGDVWQFIPVDRRADCNVAANPFAVSVETQDSGAATLNVTPWNAPQIEAIVKLLIWLRDEWGVPMVRCTAWNGSGVGAHRDFPQWSGGSHSCPGNARFAQVPDIIALAALTGEGLPPLDNPPVFDTTPTQPCGLVPLYTEDSNMAAPYRITSPKFAAQLIRWPSGALGWCTHAEAGLYSEGHDEADDNTFMALMTACTVPPVPASQQTILK